MNETELDRFVRTNGLHPYGKIDYRGTTLYIAETELETNKPKEYPWGYYQTAFFVSASASKGKIDGGSWVEFDAMHDSEEGWTQEEKRNKRIQSAIEYGKEWVDKNIETGRYERH